MGRFLENRIVLAVSSLLASAIVASALLRTPKPSGPAETASDPPQRIAFRSASGPGGLRCVLKVDRGLGYEFRASAMGSDQVSTAFDGENLWFWARYWDRKRFHFCSSEEIDEVGLNPMFRPLFLRSVSGGEFLWKEHPKDGTLRSKDGEYDVRVRFDDGVARSQSYSLDGKEVMSVRFVEYQRVGGFDLPRRITVFLEGSEGIDLDMGHAEIDPEDPPLTNPPEGMEGERLPIR